MRTYSIKELENYSGTKAHTIRIWEQRYNLLTPHRTDTGIRFYNDADLKKILITSVLLKGGFKISKIAQLSDEDLKIEVTKIDGTSDITSDTKIELHISNLLTAGLNFDEIAMNTEFDRIIKTFDLYSTFIKIVYPLLNRVGIMWGKNDIDPLQEHFISNSIRKQLNIATNKLPNPSNTTDEIVLFLPENETHEIGLLFANFLLKEANIKTIYLGQQVPTISLIKLIKDRKIKRALGFIFYSSGKEKLIKSVNNLISSCEETLFYWSGNMDTLNLLNIHKNQTILKSLNDFQQQLISPKR